jgi:DNA-binding Lrp family transcriptional regulator
MDTIDFRLLNDYQHGFPLCASPFERIGAALGIGEDEVIERYASARRDGRIARIGAVFAPRTIGASTLAAMRVPAARLAEVAAQISAFPGVNHNYEREHEFNLWFVVTAASAAQLTSTLAAIEAASNLPVLRLPLEEEYHIDLGFALDRLHGYPDQPAAARFVAPPAAVRLDSGGQALVAQLQEGLPLVTHPFSVLARRLQIAETALVSRLEIWLANGILKRFGVVVRHRELGYTANAMLVQDIPDERVAEIGQRLGREAAVTLCYRRPRALPAWPYNLFCMIHGCERGAVEQQIVELRRRHGLEAFPHAVLFSRTRFKQQGARYAEAVAG